MPVGNLMCVVRYLLQAADGRFYEHLWFKRVSSGREGVALRDRIVSNGKGPDDRVMVTGCRFIALDDQTSASVRSAA